MNTNTDTNKNSEVGVIISRLDDVVDWGSLAGVTATTQKGMKSVIDNIIGKIKWITNQHRPEGMLGD